MTTRSRRETVTFQHPFRIKGIDRSLPAGAYKVITDEQMIEGLSFAAYRRVAPAQFDDGDDLHRLGRPCGRATHRCERRQ
jgi:hypothetical protein